MLTNGTSMLFQRVAEHHSRAIDDRDVYTALQLLLIDIFNNLIESVPDEPGWVFRVAGRKIVFSPMDCCGCICERGGNS